MCGQDTMSSSPVFHTFKGTDCSVPELLSSLCMNQNKCKAEDGVYLRWPDLADAAFLCDRSDLADEAEWIREILPARLKHRALRRRQELRVHSHHEG